MLTVVAAPDADIDGAGYSSGSSGETFGRLAAICAAVANRPPSKRRTGARQKPRINADWRGGPPPFSQQRRGRNVGKGPPPGLPSPQTFTPGLQKIFISHSIPHCLNSRAPPPLP